MRIVIPLAALAAAALAALLAALQSPVPSPVLTSPKPQPSPCAAALEDCQRALDQHRDAERVLQCLVGGQE